MKLEQISQIFKDTAYVRTGGSAEELVCANYIKGKCAEYGLEAHLEDFEVEMADILEAVLVVDGEEIPCKGYKCAGTATVEAPFYYLRNMDKYSLSQCKGKIVMIDGGMRRWVYQDLMDNGAVGFITYDGNANYADNDMDQKELRAVVRLDTKMPGVNINAKSAIALVRDGVQNAKIVLKQNEYMGNSRNVVLDLPGEIDEMIVLTAHYDSTSLSQGAYDNMSGCVSLLDMAEYFAKAPHRYSLRFVWCGSEERGLLGSKAHTAMHEDELNKMVLNVNMDMIGCIMGKFIACVTAEEKLMNYIEYMAAEEGFGIAVSQKVYSSDSTPFADKGVPALSFARIAPNNTATIHNRYDTLDVMSAEQMEIDMEFIRKFVDRMANAKRCPVAKVIPDNMKEKLDIYLLRKRGEMK